MAQAVLSLEERTERTAEFPPIRPTFNGILSERDPLFRGAGPLLLIILALCWPSDKARAPGPGLRGRVRSGPPRSGPSRRRHAPVCTSAAAWLRATPRASTSLRGFPLPRVPSPPVLPASSADASSGPQDGYESEPSLSQRLLPAHRAREAREASAHVPGVGPAALVDAPRRDPNRADPSTDLGLLRARARLSVTAPCKSDLVLSIWHPNASRAPTAPHSHTRDRQGSSVYTWHLLHNKQPLEDGRMEPAGASRGQLFPAGNRTQSGCGPRGRPVTHWRGNRLLHAGSPARLPEPESRSVPRRAACSAARRPPLLCLGLKVVPRRQSKGQRGSQRPSCRPSKSVRTRRLPRRPRDCDPRTLPPTSRTCRTPFTPLRSPFSKLSRGNEMMLFIF